MIIDKARKFGKKKKVLNHEYLRFGFFTFSLPRPPSPTEAETIFFYVIIVPCGWDKDVHVAFA